MITSRVPRAYPVRDETPSVSHAIIPQANTSPFYVAGRRVTNNHFVRGALAAPIFVVCDPPSPETYGIHAPISLSDRETLSRAAKQAGFRAEDFVFVGLCPPIPEDAADSSSRRWAHVMPFAESIWEIIRKAKPKCILTFGDLATRVIAGRAIAITKSRGQPFQAESIPVFPMLSPAFVSRIPDHLPTFYSDWASLKRFQQGGYVVEDATSEMTYEWREDISDIVEMVNRGEVSYLGIDTETTGLRWYDPQVRVLTVQLSYRIGHAVVCPVDAYFWPEWRAKPRGRSRLLADLRNLLQNSEVGKGGFNLKFDVHMLRKLGIELRGWEDDMQMMAFAVDENMMEKSQEECLRRWSPELAVAKASVTQSEKENMADVPRDKFLLYAGSDTDGVLRLKKKLTNLLNQDLLQHRLYRMVQMPALRAFAYTVERNGMLVDQHHLQVFGAEVNAFCESEYDRLIRMTPAKVKRAHLDAKKELSFTRAAFLKDILFTPEGFNLKPVVFTKGTRNIKDETKREPSTSAKEHLPFFIDREDKAGEFVNGLIGYSKAKTLAGTFIGNHADGTGLWQYISPESRIFPSYQLHVAVTGRSSSRDPNGQNFPKRGIWAKPYQKVFKASPGFKLINADLSQAELRIAAWMANDATMLRVYNEDGDIHVMTAQSSMQLNDAQWAALSKPQKKEGRQKAKAVNFGFIFGMGAVKFKSFAKTDYNVEYTLKESYSEREIFFSKYSSLENWHKTQRATVKQLGYVRALHGAVRHLPSIWSSDEAIRSGAERMAINSPVQRFASDLGIMAMARFSAQADPEIFRFIGFVHDALVMEVRDGYEKEGVEALLWTMNNPPLEDWFGIRAPLPIRADADMGLNNGEMLELGDLPELSKRPEWFQELGWDTVTPTKPLWWNDEIDSDPSRIFATVGF